MSENVSLKEIMKFRMDKLKVLRDKGIEPYPHKYEFSHKNIDIYNNQKDFLCEDSRSEIVSVAGRIVSLRNMGKSAFLHIQDDTGKLQVYLNNKNISDDLEKLVCENLDLGDIIGCRGEVFLTKTEELSIRAQNITLLAKNIRPLPNLKEKDGEAFNAFSDKESRYRYRHLDLIANPANRDVFRKRSDIINYLRAFLNSNDYLEVETPVLQPLYGGATARPFKTFHNALDRELFLRIADELYLKRLVIGGYDKVFEIAKDFRNEGVDRSHNPEFTMCEFYQAYSDVYDMMDMTEGLIKHIAQEMKIDKITFNSHPVNFKDEFDKVSFVEELSKALDCDFLNLNKDELICIAEDKGISLDNSLSYGKVVDKLFGELVEPNLINPTFVLDYPKLISPLAKKKRDAEIDVVERFELFIGGMEFANSFSELNDPVEQRFRLEEIIKSTTKIDKEIQLIDEEFISAMESGMPPMGGVGIGVDRLVMLFTGQSSIRDVILFPVLRY
tara:strand:+ start:3053 stop:4552 length:1500 start_codon:yes stop_codon:yes gene_type:complete